MTRNEIIAAVKELGIKTERPAHQMKTEALQALLTTNTNEVKARGRKINPASARQQRLAAWEARKAAGETIQRGRPRVAVA